MNKTDRAVFILNELEKLFPKTPVPLKHNSHYELLVAVLLSAQCTDERVNKITPLLFKKANTPKKMIELEIDDIYKNKFEENGYFIITFPISDLKRKFFIDTVHVTPKGSEAIADNYAKILGLKLKDN